MPNYRRLSLAFIFTLLLGLAAPAVVAQEKSASWTTLEDHWYVLEIAGARAGHSHRLVQTDGDRYRTASDVQMKISRGGFDIEITMGSSFIETKDGRPIMFQSVQKAATMSMKMTWEFAEDHVKQTTEQGGRVTTVQQPLPEGEWFTPRAADRYVKQHRQEGAETITYRTIDPNSGLRLMTLTLKRAGKETIEHAGKSVDVTTWRTTTDAMPGMETIEKIGPDGVPLYTEVPMPGMGKMVLRLTTREEVKGGEAEPAPELLIQTFVAPDQPIKRPMQTVRSKLRLKMKDGTLPDLPSAGAQRVEMAADRKSAVLTININDNLPATEAETNDATYRSASAMIDSDDEFIRELTQRALAKDDETEEAAGADDLMQKAETLRKFVRRHISKKDMGTGFASASETAKTRTGDCSEHGVLLAAMLRAAGIPARVTTGLIYADAFEGHRDIFGWHMWTQALIDGKWVDFDATLPRRYNAVHVLTSVSSLRDGMSSADLAPVMQLLGNIEIEVLEVEHE